MFLQKWKLKSTEEMFLPLHGYVSRGEIHGKRFSLLDSRCDEKQGNVKSLEQRRLIWRNSQNRLRSNYESARFFETSGELQDSRLAEMRAQDLQADRELRFSFSAWN